MATKIFSRLIRLDQSTARSNRSEITAILHVNFYRQTSKEHALTIDLQEVGPEFIQVRFSGEVTQVGRAVTGQCADEVLRYWGHITEIAKYCALWERWGDNEKRIGTRDQISALEGVLDIDFDNYEMWVKAYLSDVGLYLDRGHRWGAGKLVEIVPQEVLYEIETVVENIRVHGSILKDCVNA
jgi:hypothetical protein